MSTLQGKQIIWFILPARFMTLSLILNKYFEFLILQHNLIKSILPMYKSLVIKNEWVVQDISYFKQHNLYLLIVQELRFIHTNIQLQNKGVKNRAMFYLIIFY